jgi:CheY-like chemotaxis protein
MPGINSFELCRQIKSEPFTKNIKVIAITKNPTKRNIQRIKKEGANACLAKPVNYTKLLDKINTLTRK